MPVPASSFNQSLGEVARQYQKEREARENEGKVPVKVFTNDDVTGMYPTTADSPQRKPSTSANPPAPQVKESESPLPTETTGGGAKTKVPGSKASEAQGGIKSKEYWQARFKAARAALSHAREEQPLVEDELRLLQIQQARELDPDRSRKLNRQIDAATIQLEAKRAATEKAEQVLAQTEEEFKKSGASRD